jgi:Ankyrin repeats (3 copies)/Ankyrin repeat
MTSDWWRAVESGDAESVQQLLDRGQNIIARDVDERTALHVAAKGGHLAVVMLLLERGADIFARDKWGDMALHEAVSFDGPESNNNQEVVKLLLDRSLNINSRGFNGYTPLIYAARKGHLELVRLLLDRRADAEVADIKRRTALRMAVDAGQERTVRLLLERGANSYCFDVRLTKPDSQVAATNYYAAVRAVREFKGQTLTSNAGYSEGFRTSLLCDCGIKRTTYDYYASLNGHCTNPSIVEAFITCKCNREFSATTMVGASRSFNSHECLFGGPFEMQNEYIVDWPSVNGNPLLMINFA